MQNRHTIRQHIRQHRLLLSEVIQKSHAEKALSQIIDKPLFLQSQNIAFYIANEGEINPLPLIYHAISLKKNCYLPILHPTLPHQLLFMPYQPEMHLKKNRYGILEPPFVSEKIVFPWCLELVFTPLVAFDNKGNRLGAGCGYYDKTFAFLKDQCSRTTKLLGMAHELQYLNQIESKEWDVALDGIVTEERFTLF